MEKGIFFLSVFLLTSLPLQASVDGHTDKGPMARPAVVFFRGVSNIVGMPLELISTGRREAQSHPRLWPVTYVPRFLTNFFIRAASGINDMFFYPWVVPYTDDISPWTEPMGLPDYPWEVH